jgi:hypothetical protein
MQRGNAFATEKHGKNNGIWRKNNKKNKKMKDNLFLNIYFRNNMHIYNKELNKMQKIYMSLFIFKINLKNKKFEILN